MSRLRAAIQQRLKHRAYVKALTARQQCCGGNCTTADQARRIR